MIGVGIFGMIELPQAPPVPIALPSTLNKRYDFPVKGSWKNCGSIAPPRWKLQINGSAKGLYGPNTELAVAAPTQCRRG